MWLTLCEKIREARLRWLGHVERKTEEDVVMRTSKMEVSGLCKIGRKRLRWVDVMQKKTKETGVQKSKGMFLYSAVSSPLDRSKRFTLFAFPGRPVHSDTNMASAGSILAMQQLRNDYSLTFPPLSVARYSFIKLSQQRRQWRERKCPNFETVAKGIRTRALSIASPAFYH